MLRFSYSEIVEKIQKAKGLTKEEIDEKVNEKIEQLLDLVSREGAAHIVANQLGVKLFENFDNRKIKISEVPKAANAISLVGRVIDFWGIKEYNKNGKSGRVANFLLGDETGAIRVVVWDEHVIGKLNVLREGDIVKIKDAYSRENRGYMELHMGSRSDLLINPEGEEVGEVNIKLSTTKAIRKQIKDLKENDEVELFGTIVQVFDPNFYFVCPNCYRKVVQDNGNYSCGEHGVVDVKKMPVFNLFFDDGSDNIRAVVFAQQTENLIGMEYNDESDIELIKKKLLGKQILLTGRVSKNQMFDRFEFIVRHAKEADPGSLIRELENDV